jgi:thiol-disulfide isomerase/thioredoxin
MAMAVTAVTTVVVPPTDRQVETAVETYRTLETRLYESEGATSSALAKARRRALSGMEILEMRPAQIARLYQGRMIGFGRQRGAALARLDAYRDDRGIEGAGAAVMRMELLGNRFVWFEDGVRQQYAPRPRLQAELLTRVLDHPALRQAVAAGDLAAVRVLSAISGLNNESLWQTYRAGILSLRELYAPDAHAMLFEDAEDYLGVVKVLAVDEPGLREEIREAIVAAGRKRHDVAEAVAQLDGAAARGELLGRPAPALDFIWSYPQKITSLDDLRGKVVVLDFWNTTCAPCIASFPNVRQLQEHYRGKPVEIVGVTSVLRDPSEIERIPEFIAERDVTWTVAFSRQSVYNPDYGVRGIPHVVILDAKGIVRHRGLHPGDPVEDKIEKIDALLAEAG